MSITCGIVPVSRHGKVRCGAGCAMMDKDAVSNIVLFVDRFNVPALHLRSGGQSAILRPLRAVATNVEIFRFPVRDGFTGERPQRFGKHASRLVEDGNGHAPIVPFHHSPHRFGPVVQRVDPTEFLLFIV